MSGAAPAANGEGMDGESDKEDAPPAPAVPNSPGEKGTRANLGQPDTPSTGTRVQSRRGLILAEKMLDTEMPAGAQAVSMATKITSNAALNKLVMGWPIPIKDQGVVKVTVKVDETEGFERYGLYNVFAVAREGLDGMGTMLIVPKACRVGVAITMLHSLFAVAFAIYAALQDWDTDLKNLENMEETTKEFDELRSGWRETCARRVLWR